MMYMSGLASRVCCWLSSAAVGSSNAGFTLVTPGSCLFLLCSLDLRHAGVMQCGYLCLLYSILRLVRPKSSDNPHAAPSLPHIPQNDLDHALSFTPRPEITSAILRLG